MQNTPAQDVAFAKACALAPAAAQLVLDMEAAGGTVPSLAHSPESSHLAALCLIRPAKLLTHTRMTPAGHAAARGLAAIAAGA